LPQYSGYLPAIESIVFVNDFITAILLFSHYSITPSRAVLALASGYLYTALFNGLVGLALLVGFSLLALFRGFTAFRQSNGDRDAATLGAALLACMVAALVYVATAGYNDTLDHHRNFLNAVRSRKPVIEDAAFGFRAAGPALLSNISYFEKRPCVWDPETMVLKG
jgi:hypothetical protein